MKKLYVLAVLAAGVSTNAQAQEMQTAYSGIYAGVEAGVDNYEVKADIDLGGGETAGFDGLSANGVTGGAFVGYHMGMGQIFIAAEGFASFSGASASVTYDDGVDDYYAKIQARESYGAAVRIGSKVAKSTAVYARGGWVNTSFKGTIDDGVDVYSESETEDGFQYGGGLETMVGPKTSLRAEYVFTDYGSAGIGNGVNVDNGTFKAGIAFRF